MKICAVEGCLKVCGTQIQNKKRYFYKYCSMHIARLRRKGVFGSSVSLRFRNPLDLLFERTDKKENGCWEFTGFKNLKGYGKLRSSGQQLAHRVSWVIHNGDIPKGMLVCHKCDNPPCCNPDHLFLGTAKDNAHDAIKKGRIDFSANGRKKRGKFKCLN